MRMPALMAYAAAAIFLLVGCQSGAGDASALQAAPAQAGAPPQGAAADAVDTTDTTDAVQAPQPKRHHYRAAISHRHIRHRAGANR